MRASPGGGQGPDAAGTQAFRQTWIDMADKLVALADEDEARGRLISAGDKLVRASNYMLTAERMLAHGSDGRVALYQRFLASFEKGLKLSGSACRRVEIPYEGKHLSALYVPAEGVTGPQPILVQVNGLDSTKEMKFLVGLPGWLAKRGVASLIVDQPGTGEALRLQDLKARFDSEHWASRVVDWLETGPKSMRDASAWRVFRSAAITVPVRSPSSRALPAAWSGAPTTTGARCRRSVSQGRQFPCAALLEPRHVGLGCQGHGRFHAHR